MVRTLNTRGCAPHGLVRETRMPRGANANRARVVDGPKRSNAIETPGGIRITGTLARQLMTVDTHSSYNRREFARFCSMFGIAYIIPQDNAIGGEWGAETVVEVIGPPAALERLSEKSFVLDSVDALNVRPPRFNSATFRRDPY